SIEITLQLPAGTKFNKDAPFRIKATSNSPGAVRIGTFSIPSPTEKLSIPIEPKSGEATITIDLDVNYCKIGTEGLCFFKEARLEIPLRVTATGAASASAVCFL